MKDIDRNITSRLYKAFNRVANLHIIGGVLHPSSGGTGVTNLSSAYPYMVTDKFYKKLTQFDLHLSNGFTLGNDCIIDFYINQKSMYIEGKMHILREEGINSNEFCFFPIGTTGYNIEGIKISSYATTMTIKNNIIRLSADFSSNNEINYNIDVFIPFI